jgi:hypothetical protein
MAVVTPVRQRGRCEGYSHFILDTGTQKLLHQGAQGPGYLGDFGYTIPFVDRSHELLYVPVVFRNTQLLEVPPVFDAKSSHQTHSAYVDSRFIVN